jgi:site-specific DNA-cytosine methylase
MKLKTIDLFAGIGGIRLGFEYFGCENVFTSEWDPDAQLMYEAQFHSYKSSHTTTKTSNSNVTYSKKLVQYYVYIKYGCQRSH